MKELSIEEKAKRYDEALWKAGELYQPSDSALLEEIFPELIKYNDEKVRGAIIHFISHTPTVPIGRINKETMLAWLEKQKVLTTEEDLQGKEDVLWCIKQAKKYAKNENEMGTCWFAEKWLEKQGEQNPIMAKSPQLGEQKPADNTEPKFHEGEWVVSPNGVYWHIDKIYNNRYEVTSNTGESSNWNLDANIYHRFTIQDAKDGDVLVVNNEIFIYAHRKQMYSIAVAHCFVDSVGGFYLDGDFGYTENGNSIHPATKEQCNQLGKAMTDAGYTFDFEKKELKKVENETEIPFGAKDSELQEATYYIPQGFHAEIDGNKVVFKKGEKPTAWSDGDKKMSRFIGNAITADDSSVYLKNKGIEVIDAHVWLDELKDRVQPQPKQEENKGNFGGVSSNWSEEDEGTLQGIIDEIRANKQDAPDYDIETYDRFLTWLKSLKDKYTWKPSEGQMEALDFAANCIVPAEFCVKRKVLKELLEQLKKLREE